MKTVVALLSLLLASCGGGGHPFVAPSQFQSSPNPWPITLKVVETPFHVADVTVPAPVGYRVP
jgi:hypothetical protein